MWRKLLLMLLASVAGTGLPVTAGQSAGRDPGFQAITIDTKGPRAAWGKGTGDINQDGLVDILIGGHRPRKPDWIERIRTKLGGAEREKTRGELVWYRNPDWEKKLISDQYAIRTDVEVADINEDGFIDIVAVTNAGLVVFAGPDWKVQRVDDRRLHDIELADLNRDGKFEIVARNQSLFGYANGDEVIIYQKVGADAWHQFTLAVPHGEGLVVHDLNGDTYPDIVTNGVWLQNPADNALGGSWQSIDYTGGWRWSDVYIDVADMDADGDHDIVLSPSEEAGERYRISWFENLTNGLQWREHVIEADVEAIHHFVGAADFNGDGRMDVAAAEMNQGEDPDEVKIYFNRANGWEKVVLSGVGSHSMRIVDIDGDFDPDLIGANWHFPGRNASYPVTLWRNDFVHKVEWKRHVIDADRPGRALFIQPADLNGDSLEDIITGAYWYANPGNNRKAWQRRPLGDGIGNLAIAADFDEDGDIDVLGSSWTGKLLQHPPLYRRVLNRLGIWAYPYGQQKRDDQFTVLKNDGSGDFHKLRVVERTEGDFLQGVAILRDTENNEIFNRVLLSWHKAGYGIQALAIPKQIETPWIWQRLSDISQDEALSTADLDNDGNDDIVLGTQWLRKTSDGQWIPETLFDTDELPDRNKVVDMNNDGRLDVVIGYQSISAPGMLAWYEQGKNPTDRWTEHVIAEVIGPMALDVKDMDGDGDYDVIVGEHHLVHPNSARLLQFENLDGKGGSWQGSLIYRGDEHHDGAVTTDIDNDGDFDIISIGWGHNRVLWYENLKN